MEQRNEMLKKMRMSEKQKRGDVQHLLARSFSTRQMSVTSPTASDPPGEISIPVPQLPRIHFDHPPNPSSAAITLSDHTMETNNGNLIPMTTITEEVGIAEEGQLGLKMRLCEIRVKLLRPPDGALSGSSSRKRRDSSSSESSEEENSVRKPLLDLPQVFGPWSP